MNQYSLYTQYSGAVGKHGVGSKEALGIRQLHSNDTAFIRFANAVDRLKQHVSNVKSDRKEETPVEA